MRISPKLGYLLGLIPLLLGPRTSLNAQALAPVACRSAGGALIVGTVVDDSTNRPIAGSRVHLLVPVCSATTDEAGRFRFEAVRPGTQRLDATYPGYRRLKPLVFSAGAGDTMHVELRLVPGGPIEDCRVLPACAPLLQETAPESLNDDERLRLTAYGATIAIAWRDVAQATPWYACVTESSPVVFVELSKRYSRVVYDNECEQRPDERGIRTRTHHAATGERGFHMGTINVEDRGAGIRRVSFGYSLGSLGGQAWYCDFERTASAWRPIVCVMTGQS